jgi:hypothetical protein
LFVNSQETDKNRSIKAIRLKRHKVVTLSAYRKKKYRWFTQSKRKKYWFTQRKRKPTRQQRRRLTERFKISREKKETRKKRREREKVIGRLRTVLIERFEIYNQKKIKKFEKVEKILSNYKQQLSKIKEEFQSSQEGLARGEEYARYILYPLGGVLVTPAGFEHI